MLRIIFAALISVVSTIFSVFTLSYAVNTAHISRPVMLTVLVLANIVALAAIPLLASLSDRIGRKPVFIGGALGCAVLIWPYIWAISQANIPLIFVLGILLSGVVYSAANGVWPSLYGEMFETARAPVGHGNRHAGRLYTRRLRAHHQCRHHGPGAGWLDAGGRLHLHHGGHRGDCRVHRTARRSARQWPNSGRAYARGR